MYQWVKPYCLEDPIITDDLHSGRDRDYKMFRYRVIFVAEMQNYHINLGKYLSSMWSSLLPEGVSNLVFTMPRYDPIS